MQTPTSGERQCSANFWFQQHPEPHARATGQAHTRALQSYTIGPGFCSRRVCAPPGAQRLAHGGVRVVRHVRRRGHRRLQAAQRPPEALPRADAREAIRGTSLSYAAPEPGRRFHVHLTRPHGRLWKCIMEGCEIESPKSIHCCALHCTAPLSSASLLCHTVSCLPTQQATAARYHRSASLSKHDAVL